MYNLKSSKKIISDNGSFINNNSFVTKPANNTGVTINIYQNGNNKRESEKRDSTKEPIVESQKEYSPENYSDETLDHHDIEEDDNQLDIEHLNETTYISNDIPYILDTSDFLSKTIDETDNMDLQVCAYKVIVDGYAPYILYLLEHDSESDSFVFPKGSIIEDGDQTLLQKMVAKYPFLASEADENFGTIEDPLFRGFYHKESNIVIATYDTTPFKTDLLEENENFIWVTPYEILGSNKVYGKSVNKMVIDFFVNIFEESDEGIDFYHLKKKGTSEKVRSPYTLYLCQKGTGFLGGGGYENVKWVADMDYILYPRVDHPKLDRFFLFSSELIVDAGSLQGNKEFMRFLVFVDVDPEIRILYDEDSTKIDHLYDGTLEEEYQVVTFIEGGKQYWSVKSPEIFLAIE